MKRLACTAIFWGTLVISAVAAAQPLPGQSLPDLAFDAANNRFLAAYLTVAAPPPETLDVRIVGPTGTPVGSELPLQSSSQLFFPRVAYDDVLHDYLLTASVGNVYGQLLSSDGAAQGAYFAINTAPAKPLHSALAFDAINRRFLVVWYEDAGAQDHVVGRLVRNDGTLASDPLPIYTATTVDLDGGPQVAFDRINQRFLVVWADPRTGNVDVYGQLLGADGTPQGTSFAISATGAPGLKTQPIVAVDNIHQRFLVTWRDGRSGDDDIYAQLLGADGTPIGGNVAIYSGAQEQTWPNIAFDALTGRYLIIWEHTTDGVHEYVEGRYVDADGNPSGADFQVSTGESSTQTRYGIAANAFCPNFLVAYPDTSAPTVLQYVVVGDACETTAPTITALSPGADATDVAVDAPITATFSEPMRASTITTGTFTVSGGVTGTVTYDEATHVATFTPASALANATTYTATVTTGVTDVIGNAMAADNTWTFTTISVPETGGGCSLILSR
jgi:hypothetical protein